MSYVPILDMLTAMQRETSEQATTMAAAVPMGLESTGASAGVSVRLRTLSDVYAAVLTLGMREYESGSA